MDSAAIISFIEAERAKIDPKHRTLELDHFAYGLIARILSAIYSEKKVVEAAALTGKEPTMLAHNVPSVAPKPKARHHDFKMQYMMNGVMRGVNFEPVEVERDGAMGIICAYCGEWYKKATTHQTYWCDKKECYAAARASFYYAKQAKVREGTSQTRICMHCKAPFAIKRLHDLKLVVCPASQNPECSRVTHGFKQNYNNWRKLGSKVPPSTAKQAAAVEFMARYNEELAKLDQDV